MRCPHCQSTSYRKNGHRSGKQNYLCKNCKRQFTEVLLNESVNTIADSGNGMAENAAIAATLSPQELPETKAETGISALLLDAENIRLDANAEKFLVSAAKYPQMVKIAFANWRNTAIGKLDAELYERGYQLIHVPNGKNSADGKMIAFGASILKPYPDVKEVFICSSDGLLIHLCNQLLAQGIIVYWVRRKDENLLLENCHTKEIKYYSVPLNTEVPSVELLMQILEDLIRSEQQSIADRMAKFSDFTALFQARSQIVQQTGSAERSLLVNSESKPNASAVGSNGEMFLDRKAASEIAELIDSKEKLERAIVNIIKSMKSKVTSEEISPNTLSKEFANLYGKPPSSAIKQLGLGRNLSKFLKSCASLKVEYKNGQYKIDVV